MSVASPLLISEESFRPLYTWNRIRTNSAVEELLLIFPTLSDGISVYLNVTSWPSSAVSVSISKYSAKLSGVSSTRVAPASAGSGVGASVGAGVGVVAFFGASV